MGFAVRALIFLAVFAIVFVIGNLSYAKENQIPEVGSSPEGTELSLLLKIRENGNALDLDLGILLESLQIASSYHIDRRNFDHKKIVSGMVTGFLRFLGDDQRERLLAVSRTEPFTEDFDGGKFFLKVTSDDGMTVKIDASYFLWSLRLAVKNGLFKKRKNSRKLAEYITKGFVQSLDRHSDYLNLEETEEYVQGFELCDTVSLVAKKHKDKTVYIIKIQEFARETSREFKRLVDNYIRDKEAYVIFDMRDCPGGLDSSTEEILGYLMGPDKVLLSEVDYADIKTVKKSTKSDGPGVGRFWKMVCLVNKETASNAEVFAGCLRDNMNVRLIGTPTYGKGVGGTIIELASGRGTCRITYTKWFTPSGVCVEEVGLRPDIIISSARNKGRDSFIEAALRDLLK